MLYFCRYLGDGQDDKECVLARWLDHLSIHSMYIKDVESTWEYMKRRNDVQYTQR